jgi:hypothetical protein
MSVVSFQMSLVAHYMKQLKAQSKVFPTEAMKA